LILADANLLSEPTKLEPDIRVLAWLEMNFDQIYLPTPVLAELRYGCEKLTQSAKRREFESWLADLTTKLEERIVTFDQRAAEAHGVLRARLQQLGKPCPPSDSYIAAIALSHDCELATRNEKDFQWTGVRLVNPWVE
jgi:predicted nucleic acid-binding protein